MVRLYNVHLIVRPWHSILYSSDDFSGLVEVREARAHTIARDAHQLTDQAQGFGCCSFSRVSVVQFGSECRPPPAMFVSRKRSSLETYLRRYPLSAAPW
jgi:hypothetical protein